MERYTSEQALNGILNILETVVGLANKNDKKDETSDMIRQLLQGAASAQKAGMGLGQQIEQMANGLDIIKNAGINDADIEFIAGSIGRLSKALNSFSVNNEKRYKGVVQAVQMLQMLGSIDERTIDNIENLSSVNVSSIKNIVELISSLNFKGLTKKLAEDIRVVANILSSFGNITEETIDNLNRLSDIDTDAFSNLIEALQGLDFSKISHIGGKDAQKNLQAISSFIAQLNSILGDGTKNLSGMFSKFRARRIGKTVGAFFDAMFDAMLKNKKEINVKVQGVAELLQALVPFISSDSAVSIYKMKKVLNQENGHQIGMFFKEMLAGIPNKKKPDAVLKQIADFLKLITTFGLGDYIKLKVLLTEKNGQQIGKFFSSIFNELKKEKYPDLKPITDFLKVLSSIGIVGAVGLMMLKPVLTEKFGKAIAGFINALVKDFDADKTKRVASFAKSIKTLSQGVMIMAATIGLLAAEIALFGPVTILEALAVNAIFLGTTLLMLKMVGKARTDISKGSAALMDIAKAMTLLALDVVIMAGTAALLQDVEWESIGKVGSIVVVLSGIAIGVMWLSNKWKKGGDNALKVMASMAILMGSVAISVGLMVLISKLGTWDDVVMGASVIVVTIALMTGIVHWMSKIDKKNLEQATKTLVTIAGVFSVITLISAFVLPLIAKNLKDVVLGGIVVGVTIALMVGVVHWMSKIDKKNLQAATTAMWHTVGIFGAISLVALFILPEVGKKWDDAAVGGIVVFGIVALMVGVVWAISKIDLKKLNIATRALIEMTAIFSVLSIVAAFMLPNIAKNIKEVAIGAVVVAGIIALMVGAVWLVGKLPEKDTRQALITMGAMTLMLVVVGSIASYMFPAIADQKDAVIAGGKVVMGIMAVMVGMTLLLGWLGNNKKMTQAYITLSVLTLMLMVVSLITTELLIPIGYEWKDAALGGAVVLGVIGLMVGAVALLGLINQDKMKRSMLTMAGITLILLAVSLIVSELLIPIGYEWKEAAKGGAVVLGTLGVMALIVALAGKMSKEQVIKGLLTIAAIELLLWSLDKALDPYIELTKAVGKDWKAISKGGAVIAATLVAWGVLLGVIGAIAQSCAQYIAIGAATVAGIGLVLYALGEMLPSYVELSLMMAKDWKKISKGGAIIAATITAWGLIFTAIGALVFGPQALVLAAGAAAVTGIGVVLYAISELFPPYIDTAKLIHDNYAILKSAGDKLPGIFSQIGKMMAKIGIIYGNPFSMIAMGAGAAAVAAIAASIWEISKIVNPFINLVKRVDDTKLTTQKVAEFTKLFVGKNSIADAIEQIVDKMNDVGAFASLKAGYIARNIKPIFDTIGTFIDVVVQSLNMKYVSEWDKDGKPSAYKTITYTMLTNAATKISQSFGVFLRELGRGMDALDGNSAYVIAVIGKSLGPVMDSVGTFAEAITAVISKGIPVEWDKDGKPTKFEPFNAMKFTEAAVHISVGFGTFLEQLGPKLEKLGPKAAHLIAILGQGIKPVMDAVATYTDLVMGFVSGKEISYTDEKGNQVTKFVKIIPEDFTKAGKTIADAFSGFIESMWNVFKKGEYTETHLFSADEHKNHIVDVINGLENIGNVVEVVGQFADLIIKVHEKQKEVNFVQMGTTMATMLTNLVDKLSTKFDTEEKIEKIEIINDGVSKMKKVIDTISKAHTAMYNIFKKGYDIKVEDITNLYTLLKTFAEPADIAILKSVTPKDIAQLPKFMDKLWDAAKVLKKFEKLGGEKQVEIQQGVTLFITQTEQLQKLKDDQHRLLVRDIAQLPAYMKKVVDTAKLLVKLADVMQNPNITNAVNAFLKDINAMTQKDLASRTQASQRAMRMFSADIKHFTSTIADSRKTVIKFTSTMKDATNALRKFDDAIINREKQRNEALKKFADMIQGIADSVGNLQNQINTLDENKIMSNFRGIGSLFEMIKGVVTGGGSNDDQKKQNPGSQNTPATQQNQGNRQQSTPVVQPMIAPGQKMMITMNFQNTRFSGFMETTPL